MTEVWAIPGAEEELWIEPLTDPSTLGRISTLHDKYPDAIIAVRTHFPRIDYEPFIQLSIEVPQILLVAAGVRAPGQGWLTEDERVQVITHWEHCTGRKVLRSDTITRF